MELFVLRIKGFCQNVGCTIQELVEYLIFPVSDSVSSRIHEEGA